MSTQIRRVIRGDLIKAEDWNSLVEELESLAIRVSNLEENAPGVGPPLIKLLDPPGALKMGDTLRIIGNNLGMSTLVSVTIANEPVNNFLSGCSDSLLVIQIPPILGIPDGGKDVDLVVTNTRGSDSWRFKLLPRETSVLSATFTVTNTAVPQEEIKADGSSYDYAFTISAYTSLDEVYDLKPAVVDRNDWEVAVIKDGQEITELQIPKSQPNPSTRDVIVRVTIPNNATGSGNLRLGLVSQRFPNVSGSSSLIPITIGTTPEEVSTAITFSTPTVIPSGNLDKGHHIVRVSTTRSVTYKIEATLAEPGKYRIEASVLDDLDGRWSPEVKNDPNPFDTFGKDETKMVTVVITASSQAPDATLVVKITEVNSLVSGEYRQAIKLLT